MTDTTVEIDADSRLDEWLAKHLAVGEVEVVVAEQQDAGVWIEIRLFISSTFIDTQAERDVIMKHVIPAVNRKLAPRLIPFVPVDLRWGLMPNQTYQSIQKICLN